MIDMTTIRNTKPVSKTVQGFISKLRKNAKDKNMGDTLEHFVRDAYNGNEELADILRRMRKAEQTRIRSKQSGTTKRLEK